MESEGTERQASVQTAREGSAAAGLVRPVPNFGSRSCVYPRSTRPCTLFHYVPSEHSSMKL
uniref:Uncharacterized protein n=1 Tax=Arundo donax TaxID=35708 RepID=A0A0A9FTT0_ARUDO